MPLAEYPTLSGVFRTTPIAGAAKATSTHLTYGVLYNWPAAMNGAASSSLNPSGVKGICPNGWHLPSDAEWGHFFPVIYTGFYSKHKSRQLKIQKDGMYFPSFQLFISIVLTNQNFRMARTAKPFVFPP
jgi:hypothetical protein